MRIGLNCLKTSPQYRGGVNSFTFGLLDGLAQSRRQHQFIIFAAPNNRHLFEGYLERRNFRLAVIDDSGREIVEGGLASRLLKRLLPARSLDSADLLYVPYCPPPAFPFPDRPTVYSIHDLQHVHYPEFFSEEALRERDLIFANCTNHAALIQASSEQMRDDFLAHFPVLTPQKVVVIQEGVNIETFRARLPGLDVRKKYALPAEFMYFPAQLWHHKNHITVLKALSRLKAKGISAPLVLSGARYEASEQLFDYIKQNGLEDQVFYLGVLPFEDVVALYQAAKFLITAVLYESSSIPILEAAAAGTPIIASQTPANLERARDLELNLFPPQDDAALANLLERIWTAQSLTRSQVEHNSRAIVRFDWSCIADGYLDAFEALMSRRGNKT